MIVMTNDQQMVFDMIIAEAAGAYASLPFKLTKFRSVRASLVRAGLVIKTSSGRYVPTPDKPVCPGNPQGQSERTPEGIA